MSLKSVRSPHIYYPAAKNKGQNETQFPSARYFQVHFEHLETQVTETKHSIDCLQKQVEILSSRLSLLTAEFIKKENQ